MLGRDSLAGGLGAAQTVRLCWLREQQVRRLWAGAGVERVTWASPGAFELRPVSLQSAFPQVSTSLASLLEPGHC